MDPSKDADRERALCVGFGDLSAWDIFADQPWWALIDIRDMLNIFHPLSLPVTGNAAGASRTLALPAGWRPPFALRFFCADDYFADAEKHKAGQPGTESFFEHRFKQVLVDDTVIWERDVIDENTHGSQTIFQVDVTSCITPGRPFKLTFRAFDKISTLERNDRDVWFIGGTWYSTHIPETEQEPRFHTSVWFADPVVGEKQAVEAVPPGVRPHDTVVAERHRARWPMPPRGGPMPSPARLEFVALTAIPSPGFPITCGIPMPSGALQDARAVRLRDSAGADLPVQTRVSGIWPDGSVRFLLLNAIAPAGAVSGEAFQLRFNEGEGTGPQAPAQVQRNGQRLTVDTGAIRLELGGHSERLIDAVRLAGQERPVLTDLSARVSILENGVATPVRTVRRRLDVVDEGPVAVRVDMTGSLEAGGQSIGRFIFRLYAYAGLPTVQTHFRVFIDVGVEEPLEVTDLALVATLPGGVRGRTDVGVVDGDPLQLNAGSVSLRQEMHKRFTWCAGDALPGEGEKAQGWIAASGANGRVQASMWRFWQQYPKSLAAHGDTLEMGLFTPTGTEPSYRPRFGEARRHDVWFTFSEEAVESGTEKALGLLSDEPPRLFDREWFCLSGAIGVLDPNWFENQPRIARWVADTYGDISTGRVTGRFGVRHFGDMPYRDEGQWMNGYWATVQGALNWGLASGDPHWLQRSFEIARHIADVDCVHIPPSHPDWDLWDGVTCALGKDHSTHSGNVRWPAFQIGESLVLHYWMTGDPDSLDAAVANAEYLIRSRAGLGSSEARSQARPLLTLLRVWQATDDRKYRDAATRYLDLKFQTEHVLDWRRGAYLQPTYQNWRCASAGLDSMYAHNIYEYYRLTGDLDAARLVVAVADSVYAESMLPQEEAIGSFVFYVRYSRNSWYYTQMAMLFFMAYDLTEDIRFLRAGRAAFERYLLCKHPEGDTYYQPFNNFGWIDPEFGGWVWEFRDVPTKPFQIMNQTPDPDPANYR